MTPEGSAVGGQVVPLTADYVPGVRAFNDRLAAAGAPWRFPETPVPDWLPRTDAAPLWQEYFVLAKDHAVHGAYALKRQEAALRGVRRRVGSFYWPLSEGTVNGAYALVAPRLLRAALALEPLLFLIGMGGTDTTTARLVRALGWRLVPVPFYFKVLHPVSFLRRLRYLRRRAAVARVLDLAAATGIGWLALRLAQARPRGLMPPDAALHAQPVHRFGEWTDTIWRASAPACSFAGVRDATALNATYPPGRDGFIRLLVSRGAGPIGWAVVEDRQCAASEYFGDLRVGTIVDGMAAASEIAAVIDAAAEFLAARGVDFVMSNQSHQAWRRALVANGFLRGPTSWVLAMSPALARLVTDSDQGQVDIHMNRGDGDGPWGTVLALGSGT